MHTNGASNRNGAGKCVVLKSSEGTILELAVRLGFEASNNDTKYEAIIIGLRRVKALGVQNLRINYDSQLIVNQLIREYYAQNQRMKAYIKLT